MNPLLFGIVGGAAVVLAFVFASKHRRVSALASGGTGTLLMCTASVLAAFSG